MVFKKLYKIKNKKPSLVVDIKLKIDNNRVLMEDNRVIDIIDDDDILDELLNDLSHIKSKRSLDFFIADNREYINNLPQEDKSMFLNTLQKRFFP